MPMIPVWWLVPIGLLLMAALIALIRERRLRYAAEEDAQQAHMTDPLTGLGNMPAYSKERVAARDHARRQAAHGERRRSEAHDKFVYLELDLVKFGQFNTDYGHDCGNRVLVAVADVLRRTFARPTDSVFRRGGDEFTVVMRETDKAGAQVALERLKRKLQTLNIPNGRGGVVTHVAIHHKITEGSGDASDEELAQLAEESGTFDKKAFGRMAEEAAAPQR